jgi:hypothetical protein
MKKREHHKKFEEIDNGLKAYKNMFLIICNFTNILRKLWIKMKTLKFCSFSGRKFSQ